MDMDYKEKKKVGIISIHYGVNFGSSLQAYALSKFIEDRYDYIVEIINYIPPRYRFSQLYRISFEDGIKKTIHKIVRDIRYYNLDKKYKKFLSCHTHVSPVIHDSEDAALRYKDFDFIVAGSDQIWNSDYNKGIDPMYYLCFASNKSRKISYAASAGKTDFTQSEWELQKDLLKDYFMISYREQYMTELMEAHGIKNGKLVLDPTYLYSSGEWGRLQKKPKKCPDKFLLMYFLDTDSPELLECANKIAKQKELKTVLICNGRKGRFNNIDYEAANLTPDYYIWLFRKAEYIVTNSFHGVSFSINMQKQFSAIKRERYNSRLDSILGLMGLTNRYIDIDDYKGAFTSINYEGVNLRKQGLLEKSVEFLDEALL